MARRTARRRPHKRQQKQKAQQGGGWGYDSVAGVSAAGAPFEARTAYDHCYSDPRAVMAPQINPIGAMQSGGACGCMAQPPMQSGGGSGTGGYGFTLNNDMGKVYADVTRGPCPTSVQTGGGPGLPAEIANSYSAGYGFGPAGVVQSSSATYLDRSDYGRTCQGGGRRRSTKRNRKTRRRGRKTGRRQH
jgi:hypothetical protein